MKKYLIERELPNIGKASGEELQGAARTSNEALAKLGQQIQWLYSYVTPDKTLCVYAARDEDIIRKHSELSGFPATSITEVTTMIDVTTAG